MPPNRMLQLALERAMEAAAAGRLTEAGLILKGDGPSRGGGTK